MITIDDLINNLKHSLREHPENMADIKPAFDYNARDRNSRFSANNYGDPNLSIFYDIYDTAMFNKNEDALIGYMNVLDFEDVTVAATYTAYDQAIMTFTTAENVYSVSWYKNRNEIDTMISLTSGTPMSIYDLLNLLNLLADRKEVNHEA